MPRLQDGIWLVVAVDMPLLPSALIRALMSSGASCACVEDHMLPMALRLDDEVRAAIEEIGRRAGRERSLRALQQRL